MTVDRRLIAPTVLESLLSRHFNFFLAACKSVLIEWPVHENDLFPISGCLLNDPSVERTPGTNVASLRYVLVRSDLYEASYELVDEAPELPHSGLQMEFE